MSQMDFNAADIPITNDFTPIPEGAYSAQIVKSEEIMTKDGSGKFLALTFKVIGPSHAGRQIIHRLNLWNKSERAVNIAKSDLAKTCRAVGIMQITDSQQLHGRPMNIVVKVDGDYNAITDFKPLSAATSQPTTPAQPAAKVAPWLKPKGDVEY